LNKFANKTILDEVRQASSLKDTLIIDCHGHLGRWNNVYLPKSDLSEIIKMMNRFGIDKLCISSFLGCSCDFRTGNDQVGAAVRKYPDRLIGYTTVNPNFPEEVAVELKRCKKEYGFVMVKIHPFCHEYPADGKAYKPVWEFANQRRSIVLSHTWEADKYCAPTMFGKIAARYPKAKIILGHSGVTYNGCEEAIAVAKRYKNIYLDIASSQPHFGILERFVDEVGAHRVLFGTDTPFLEPACQIGKVAFAKISENQKRQILGLNMKNLLDSIRCS
jgi:hypothetical protein